MTTATDNATLQAATIFEIGQDVVSNTQALLGGTLVLLGLIAGLIIAFSGGRPTITRTIWAVIVGGLIAGLGAFITVISGAFQETLQQSGTPAASETVNEQVVTVDALDDLTLS